MNKHKIGCVILAAGNSRRFGSNKLTAEFNGKMIAEHIMKSVSECSFYRVVTVTQYDSIQALAFRYSFRCVRNEHPETGVSGSIRLGTEQLSDCDGILYCTADQPLLSAASIRSILAAFELHPCNVICAAVNGNQRNPCLFPAAYFDRLRLLEGDKGGRSLIRNKEWIPVEIPEEETIDCDTPDMLKELLDRKEGSQ